VFSGQFAHTIDAKGRVSIPATFRDHLLDDPRIVLAPFAAFGNQCLDAYPPSEWQKLLEKFEALPRFSPGAVRFELGYLGRAHWCDLDAAGRVLVPPALRKYADLKKDVVFLGQHRRFRLLSQEAWAKIEGGIDALGAGSSSMYEDTGI
jgi:MraZ protein